MISACIPGGTKDSLKGGGPLLMTTGRHGVAIEPPELQWELFGAVRLNRSEKISNLAGKQAAGITVAHPTHLHSFRLCSCQNTGSSQCGRCPTHVELHPEAQHSSKYKTKQRPTVGRGCHQILTVRQPLSGAHMDSCQRNRSVSTHSSIMLPAPAFRL